MLEVEGGNMSSQPYCVPDDVLQAAESKWREAVDDELLSGRVPDPVGLMAQMAWAERTRAVTICEDRAAKHRLAAKIYQGDEASACACLDSAVEALDIAIAIKGRAT